VIQEEFRSEKGVRVSCWTRRVILKGRSIPGEKKVLRGQFWGSWHPCEAIRR
jgi:hypothetical protein